MQRIVCVPPGCARVPCIWSRQRFKGRATCFLGQDTVWMVFQAQTVLSRNERRRNASSMEVFFSYEHNIYGMPFGFSHLGIQFVRGRHNWLWISKKSSWVIGQIRVFDVERDGETCSPPHPMFSWSTCVTNIEPQRKYLFYLLYCLAYTSCTRRRFKWKKGQL